MMKEMYQPGDHLSPGRVETTNVGEDSTAGERVDFMQVVESFTFDEYHKLQAVADATRTFTEKYARNRDMEKGGCLEVYVHEVRPMADALDELDGGEVDEYDVTNSCAPLPPDFFTAHPAFAEKDGSGAPTAKLYVDGGEWGSERSDGKLDGDE